MAAPALAPEAPPIPPLDDRLLPAFRPALERFALERIDDYPNPLCGLLPDLRIAYLNKGWFAAANANGARAALAAWGPGADFCAAVRGPLRSFYEKLLAHALRDGRPFTHKYECPTPTRRQQFWMQGTPLGADGLLVTHALVIAETLAPEPGEAGPVARYRGRGGLVVQCGHCRRVRRAAEPLVWDWVPALVAEPPPETSHGLCEPCLGYYYPP
jgi:hypothetical protein